MRVSLLFPPQWNPILPHLALPALTGYLRSCGTQVDQRDLNIEAYDYFLSKQTLTRALETTWDHHRRLGRLKRRSALEETEFDYLTQVLTNAVDLVEDAALALQVLRGPAFFEPEENLGAALTVFDALQLASAPYFPTQLGWFGYQTMTSPDATQGILAAIADQQHNMCRPFYEQGILRDLYHAMPDLIGISISSVHQVIPGLTLASMIKALNPEVHLVIGGKMVTCWRDQLPGNHELFALFDSAIYHDGEQALQALVECLDERRPLDQVPNLIYREGQRIRVSQAHVSADVAQLPPPDFEGLPLDKYLVPTTMLPIEACRGCYWRQCAFCNLGYGHSRDYRPRQAAQIVDEMAHLQQRHGVQHFFFVDEALPPALLRNLARELVARGVQATWCACARFDPALDHALLTEIAAAGCRLLNYGLESGAQAVLDSLHKGTDLATISRVLRQGAEAGIWNHVFCFFGFPGETTEDAEQTMAFVRDHLDAIGSIAAGTFVMDKGADVCDHHADYAVARVVRDPDADLAFQYSYEVSAGQSAEQAAQSLQQFATMLDAHRRPQVFITDGYNLLYAAHVKDPGQLSPPPEKET